MLNNESLKRDHFEEHELQHMKRSSVSEIELTMPKNLEQLLIWTSELAAFDHYQFLTLLKKFKAMTEVEQDRNRGLKFELEKYREEARKLNRTKDIYLYRLLNQDQATIKGFIEHPVKENTQYAVVIFGGYEFLTLANVSIKAKYPIHIIDFNPTNKVENITDIHEDQAQLLSSVGDFVKPVISQCKKIARRNSEIRLHNAIVDKILKRRK